MSKQDHVTTNTTGADNVAIGREALEANNADHNTAVGRTALHVNTTGTHNQAVGNYSVVGGYANCGCSLNAAILGGVNNEIKDDTSYSFIGGGYYNKICDYNFYF